ncbi:MAG: hypothetical protein GX628_09550 [Clostridiales bacterium]|nr:hypothetical protein [Clostridiales bacterium]
MRKKLVQMSLSYIYNDLSQAIEEKKPKLISLFEKHIDFEKKIPASFYHAFYLQCGRSHIHHLENHIRALILQKILGIPTDKLLLDILRCSSDSRPIFSSSGSFSFFDRALGGFRRRLSSFYVFFFGVLQSANRLK